MDGGQDGKGEEYIGIISTEARIIDFYEELYKDHPEFFYELDLKYEESDLSDKFIALNLNDININLLLTIIDQKQLDPDDFILKNNGYNSFTNIVTLALNLSSQELLVAIITPPERAKSLICAYYSLTGITSKYQSNTHLSPIIHGLVGKSGHYMQIFFKYKQSLENENLVPTELLNLIHDIGNNIDEMWDRGIIHRDIKPSNILTETTKEGVKRYLNHDFETACELELFYAVDDVTGTVPFLNIYRQYEKNNIEISPDLHSLAISVLYLMLPGNDYDRFDHTLKIMGIYDWKNTNIFIDLYSKI